MTLNDLLTRKISNSHGQDQYLLCKCWNMNLYGHMRSKVTNDKPWISIPQIPYFILPGWFGITKPEGVYWTRWLFFDKMVPRVDAQIERFLNLMTKKVFCTNWMLFSVEFWTPTFANYQSDKFEPFDMHYKSLH